MTVATSRKVITPFATCSYPVITDAQLARATARNAAGSMGGKTKRAVTFVIAPGENTAELYASAALAASEKFGDKIKVGAKTYTGGEALEKGIIRTPFRVDAEAKGYPDGSTFFSAKTEGVIRCLWPNLEPMTDEEIEDKFYPGAIIRGSVTFYGYDTNGNKGVSAAINNLQWVKDGDRLDGRVAAENEFTALDSTPADISALVG